MMAFFLTLAVGWAVIAFGLAGLLAYRYCRFCRAFNRQCLQPELRNYD
ncbi:hypothetical protein MXM81_14420 [Serratia plymuthica]|nr:hypothetical protein [Serratia plymuthica]MEB6540276.1 hypothetical protein [Serratia plymuthica]